MFPLTMEPSQIIVGLAVGVLATLTYQGKFTSAFARFGTLNTEGKYMKMVMVVRNDLGMGKGKIAAQCAHAAVGCVEKAKNRENPCLKKWANQGQPKIVLKSDQPGEQILYELAAKARSKGITNVVIHDAGHTQVQSGTATVLGLGPASAELIDTIAGHLKLL